MVNVVIVHGFNACAIHLVALLAEDPQVENIRVIDRKLPGMTVMKERYKQAYNKADFIQSSLLTSEIATSAFTKEEVEWDFIFYFNHEYKLGLPANTYEAGILIPGLETAKQALKYNSVFVNFSTVSFCYKRSVGDPPATEECPVKWPGHSIYLRYQVLMEKKLNDISNLRLIHVRPAVPYGMNAIVGLPQTVVIGRLHKETGETFYDLYPPELGLNTVHMNDLARGMIHLAHWYNNTNQVGVHIFNLADSGYTTHAKLLQVIGQLWKIKTAYLGWAKSSLMMIALRLESIRKKVNDRNGEIWLKLLKRDKIINTPLSPYLDMDLMSGNDNAIDGTKITRVTGFVYEYPKLTVKALREIVEEWKALGIFPQDENDDDIWSDEDS